MTGARNDNRTPPHGGNLRAASARYGIPESDFLDFSANINPLGVSPRARAALQQADDALLNYPDPDCSRLRSALAAHLKIAPENILPANGSIELIFALPRALGAARALVPAPTFSEYENGMRAAGGECRYVDPGDGLAPDLPAIEAGLAAGGLVFICNPNNPTGALVEKDRLIALAEQAAKQAAVLVVDEAFMEYVEENGAYSLIPDCVRLPVNALAQIAAAESLTDDEFITASLAHVLAEREYLFGKLAAIPGIAPFAPTANFVFCRIESGLTASELRELAGGKGILIRDCSNYRRLSDNYFRVAVKDRAANDALIRALQETFGEGV